MTGSQIQYGLNIKKNVLGSQAILGKRKIFFDEKEDLEDNTKGAKVDEEEVREIGGLHENLDSPIKPCMLAPSQSKKNRVPTGGSSKKTPNLMSASDLPTSFTSKKYEDAARNLDASIYEYDTIYDSLKQSKTKPKDDDRKPRYMANLIAAAAIRKRDITIAEEKKLSREREAEGDEFADKEKFVTSAYKKQQEENRRLEREERTREELEAKKNVGTGMLNFYKNVLEKEDKRHAEILKAVDQRVKNGPVEGEETQREKTAAEIAREINEKKSGSIIVNDEGDVVDKRQLLTGGLNINSRKSKVSKTSAHLVDPNSSEGARGFKGFYGSGGGKEAMRQRQSRMIEAQLEQVSKRALEQKEEERIKIERASKSRKTEVEIMSVKERFLARKREAELKKKAT